MTATIEHGIQIPSHKNRGRKRSLIPFDELPVAVVKPDGKVVGDCISLKVKTQKEFGSIRQMAQYRSRKTGARFSCLFFPGEQIGRVWRIG